MTTATKKTPATQGQRLPKHHNNDKKRTVRKSVKRKEDDFRILAGLPHSMVRFVRKLRETGVPLKKMQPDSPPVLRKTGYPDTFQS